MATTTKPVETGRPAREPVNGHRSADGRAASVTTKGSKASYDVETGDTVYVDGEWKRVTSADFSKGMYTLTFDDGTKRSYNEGATLTVKSISVNERIINAMEMSKQVLSSVCKDGTDLLSFMRHVKTACSLTDPDRGHAHEVLKNHFGSRREDIVRKAAMGENSGTVGGYLLPTAISLQLLKSLAERSFIYPRALVVPMNTRDLNAPIFDLAGGAAGQSPFVGGMAFNWGSAPTPPETEPTFGNVNLTAWDLIGYTRVSNQFLSDAGPEAEKLYVELFAMAAAVQAEYGFMQGTGTANNMPLGAIPSPCCIKVARAVTAQISEADVANMAGKMIPLGWRNAVWVANPSTLPQLFKIANFQKNMPFEGDQGCCGHLFTRPVFPSEKVPALGSLGDLTFFDPSLYVVGVRTEVLVSASEHSRFQNNQTEFMVVLRADGKPLMNNSVTLMDGSSTASMVVALQ